VARGRANNDKRMPSSNLTHWLNLSAAQKTLIGQLAQAALDARAAAFAADSDNTLATLYDPDLMPTELRKAHSKLDKAVDTAYGYKGAANDTGRVACLFDLYQRLTSLLPAAKVAKKTKAALPR